MDLPSLKIVLLGDSGVGKTTIIARWMTGKYYQSLKPTVGTNHQRKIVQIQDKDVELFIWDTAGQEQFHSLMPMYARNAAAVIVVCAIDDLESMKNLTSCIEISKNSSEKTPPIILGVNKIDKKDDYAFSEQKIEEMYSKDLNGVFFVSALTGENIDNLIMQAAKAAYETIKVIQSQPVIIEKEETQKGCC